MTKSKQVELSSLVDAYGRADEQEKAFKKTKDSIKEQLKTMELGVGTHEGEVYQLKVVSVPIVEYNVKKIFLKLGVDKFLKCSKILVEKVKEYIAPAELNAYVEKAGETTRYVASKRKEG